MKIYLAYITLDYEGILEPSMKLFENKTSAGKYICSLRKIHGNIIDGKYEIREFDLQTQNNHNHEKLDKTGTS